LCLNINPIGVVTIQKPMNIENEKIISEIKTAGEELAKAAGEEVVMTEEKGVTV
jgi:hypothetical protein